MYAFTSENELAEYTVLHFAVSPSAYAHEPILKQIQPHISKGTYVGAIPAPGCFDLMAKYTLGSEFIAENDIVIFGGSSLPWACRTTEYGRAVNLLGAKTVVDVTASPDLPASNARLASLLTDMHHVTKYRVGGHFLITSMWPTNCIIHTCGNRSPSPCIQIAF